MGRCYALYRIAATSTIVGSVLGTAIPIPGVGTAIGAVAGTYIRNTLTESVEPRHENVGCIKLE